MYCHEFGQQLRGKERNQHAEDYARTKQGPRLRSVRFDTLFNKRDYAAGRWWVKDKTGKSVLKPPGWSPDTQKKIVEGAAAVGVGAAIGYGVNFIINTAPEWHLLLRLSS
jgi:hypothetical protein